MRSRGALLPLTALALVLATQSIAERKAAAQLAPRVHSEKQAASAGPSTSTSLSDHFGFPVAKRLMDSADPASRLRGIARAAAVGTPEAVDRLKAAADAASQGHSDPRDAIELVRALSHFTDQPSVRKILALFLGSAAVTGGYPMLGRGGILSDDSDIGARFDLARQTAARAIAQSGELSDLLKAAQSESAAGDAARQALLSISLPPSFTLSTAAFTRVTVIDLASALGDTRAMPGLRIASHSTESTVRAASIEALAQLGDETSIPLARGALSDKSPRVRIAGAHALAIFRADERFKAVQALIDDDVTLDAGIALAEDTQNADITKSLGQRLATSQSTDVRRNIVAALGRADSLDALRVLAAFVKDPDVGADVARAIAGSPSSGAMVVIEKMIADKSVSRLGVRAYVVKASSTGESSDMANDAVDALAKSRDGSERALGIFSKLALGKGDLAAALDDPDARVRRAAATAMLDARYEQKRKILLDRLPREKDEGVRTLAAIALLDPDARSRVPTLALIDRATSGGPDAALATLARAARKREGADEAVAAALSASDTTTRIHAALGLGQSGAPDATGILANAYSYEADASVRHAIIVAIAGAAPADSVSRLSTLKLAATLDPDRPTRMIAVRALRNLPPISPAPTQMAWIHLQAGDGEKPPAAMLGAVQRSDGIAVPVAFDDDGFALVPGMPLGPARLVLAPRLPSDKDVAR